MHRLIWRLSPAKAEDVSGGVVTALRSAPQRRSSTVAEGFTGAPDQAEEKQLRGGSSSSLLRSSGLLVVPGIGPRNLCRLVDEGFGGVADLERLYKDKYVGKSSDKMVEFLQSSVGILHRSHAKSITCYIKERVDEELKEKDQQLDKKALQKKGLQTFYVEGSISVG